MIDWTKQRNSDPITAEFRLVPIQPEMCNYNPNSVSFKKNQKKIYLSTGFIILECILE